MDICEKFRDYLGEKIALYGLGTETERFISREGTQFEIVGLLDGFRNCGRLYGEDIIDIKECPEKEVKLIIVVARPGSCKAIARKISDFCLENKIALMDIRGKDLLFEKKDFFTFQKIISELDGRVDCGDVRYTLFQRRIRKVKQEMNLRENDKFCVHHPHDIGYLFCAPIITDFVIWMYRYVEEREIKNVLMCARDGYLINRLYKRLGGISWYFYTSRTAAIRAGVSDVNDLAYVDSMKFSGSFKQNMSQRFGIEVETKDEEQESYGAVDYADIILKRSERLKAGYGKYVESLCLQEGTVAFFDFVAKGTTQLFLNKIMDKHIVGLYFLQLEPVFMKDKGVDIVPFYTEEELEMSAIYDNYYILETILTSDEASVSEIDEDGTIVFSKETRSEAAIQCSLEVQKGIEEYFDDFLTESNDGTIEGNKQADEFFLEMIHHVQILSDDFLDMMIEDSFFNRMTKITDVL